MKVAYGNADFRKSLEVQGLEPITSTPAEFGDRIKTEYARWTKVIKDAGSARNSSPMHCTR